jgi:hemin uptake protein HemP
LQSSLNKVIITRIILIYIESVLIAMPIQHEPETTNTECVSASNSKKNLHIRIKSEDLFQLNREIEIEHAGRIYRLQLTQSNKMILTA